MAPLSAHSSDLSRAVDNLTKQTGLIGYRNVISYVSALGLRVFPTAAMNEGSWKPLDSGSYSMIYKGVLHDKSEGSSVVAIKQPNGSLARDKPEVENRMQHLALSSMIQELRILADPKLRSHPNLPNILGVYFQEEKTVPGVRPCLIFDLAISNFKDVLMANSQQRRETVELVKACFQICNGLCALHAYGLVHGDVKPENVLMFERGGELIAKVADLGTCGVQSQSEEIIGTPSFWAPEVHPQSPFRAFVNHPSRDTYSFGLVAYVAAIRYRDNPFPRQMQKQFSLQHIEKACLDSLLSNMPQETKFDSILRETVRLCVRTDPSQRPSTLDISRMLEESLGQDSELDKLQDIVEKTLISDPNSPRVNIIEQMPLPDYLRSKLQAEFTILAREDINIRTALTMSAFYSGILGSGIERPWDLIAQTQWLLKAIELGSYAAVSTIIQDENILTVLETFGLQVLELHRPFFESPEVDAERLRHRVDEFGRMGDKDISSKIIPLIRTIATAEDSISGLGPQLTAMELIGDTGYHRSPERDAFLKQFTVTRGSDLSLLDSDAFDISFLEKEEIVKSAYNNDLETFIMLAEESSLSRGSERLHYYASVAGMNGSFEVVRFLKEHFGEGPNDSWQDVTHIENSILFGRRRIVRYYLEKGADLVPKDSRRPSLLHYVSRYDDEDLARAICKRLKDQGILRQALRWMPTGEVYTHKTPLWAAVTTGAWKVSRLYMELGADVDLDGDDDRVLDAAVKPRSPSPPIEILRNILLSGAEPNLFTQGSNPALQWPVWTSNVLAVYELLLHGAKPVLTEEHDFFQLAEEVLQERRDKRPVDVVDEDGKVVEDSWTNAIKASSLALDMMTVARDGQPGHESHIRGLVESADKECLGKYWMAIGDGPSMGAIEVKVPLFM